MVGDYHTHEIDGMVVLGALSFALAVLLLYVAVLPILGTERIQTLANLSDGHWECIEWVKTGARYDCFAYRTGMADNASCIGGRIMRNVTLAECKRMQEDVETHLIIRDRWLCLREVWVKGVK